jgi:hypothetical protein
MAANYFKKKCEEFEEMKLVYYGLKELSYSFMTVS